MRSQTEAHGELRREDADRLVAWAPEHFGVDTADIEAIVHNAAKTTIRGRALRLLSRPEVDAAAVRALRAEAGSWGLAVGRDLELTPLQLRALFAAEAVAAIEVREQARGAEAAASQARDAEAAAALVGGKSTWAAVELSREGLGLEPHEAAAALRDILVRRCRSCLVNALADVRLGNEARAVSELGRLLRVAAYLAEAGEDISLEATGLAQSASIAMRRRLCQAYAAGLLRGAPATADAAVAELEAFLGLLPAP